MKTDKREEKTADSARCQSCTSAVGVSSRMVDLQGWPKSGYASLIQICRGTVVRNNIKHAKAISIK